MLELSKWNLQLFAEGEDDLGTDPAEGQNPEGGAKESEEPDKGAEKKYSDAEVDAIIERRLARERKANEEAVKSAKEEAEKLAEMNAEQKHQYEMEKLQQENQRLQAEVMKTELSKTATTLLRDAKIEATQDILDFVVGPDADTTKANIDKFAAIIEGQLKAAEVERATGKTPKSYGSGGATLSEMDKQMAARLAKYQ